MASFYPGRDVAVILGDFDVRLRRRPDGGCATGFLSPAITHTSVELCSAR
jgi:hypothetical protein